MKCVGMLFGIGFLAFSVATGWGQDAKQQKAVDVSGDWEITSETPRGTMTRNITFKQEGSVLTGSIETQNGSLPIQKGTVEGNKISFTIVMSRGDRSFEMTYTGTVDGDTCKGTFQTPRGEVPWTGKRTKKGS